MDDRAGAFHALPQLNVNGYNQMSQGYPSHENNRMATAKANVFHIRSNHSLTAGFDFRHQIRTRFDGGNTSGNFTFDNTFTRREDDGLTPDAQLGRLHDGTSYQRRCLPCLHR